MIPPTTESVTPLADTPRPLVILTPDLNLSPDEPTLILLRDIVEREIGSKEIYTITNCDYVSPEGPNYLFTIKPYYREVEPGKWEFRDGYQNRKIWPSRQQKQLETMSETVYALSQGYKHIPDLRGQCLERLEKILTVFFVDPETMMKPEVKYVQCVPSHIPMESDHAFAISIRFLLLVSQGLRHVDLPHPLGTKIKSWFAAHIAYLRHSRPGQRARDWGNNVTIWYHVIVASHMRYVSPQEGIAYASEWLTTTKETHQMAVELFKREVERVRPAHYSLFTLEPLFLLSALSTADQATPEDWAITWLKDLVEYARNIPVGNIEVVRERDGRVELKLRWFEKMLARWEHRDYTGELDGSLWELGWKDFAKLLWGFL